MRVFIRVMVGIFWLLLATVLKWAFDHFLWDWFVQFLDVRWHFKEATLIASVSSYVLPLLFSLFCVAAIYWLARRELQLLSVDATGPALAPDTQRYMTAYEVLHYLADDSKWGDEIRKYVSPDQYVSAAGNITMRKMPLLEAQGEFRRIAEQGRIRAVGRLDGDGQHVQIPETYWMSAVLSPFSFHNQEISEAIPAVYNPDGIPTYKRVKIVREDVERAWPLARKGWLYQTMKLFSRGGKT